MATSAPAVPEAWLVGDEATRAWAAIDDVAAALTALPREALLGDPTLASGAAGMALFFAYLAGVQEGRGHEDVAARFLDWAQEDVAAGRIPFGAGLYQGFTGVAWVAEHITGEAQDSIDEHMATYLGRTPWLEDYDLISGLAGYGVWALEALPRAGAAECLGLVCERLIERAQPAAGGVGMTWWTPPAHLPTHQLESFPGGYENFGLAHGFPAAIAVLAQACASGALAPALAARARDVARGGVERLRAVARQGGYSRYPTTMDDKIGPEESRLAWCYGDPGVAAALAVAAAALPDEPSWRAEAEATALAIARRDPRSAGFNDAGLCHGSAGVAVLLARLHRQFGHDDLAAATRYWFAHALGLRQPASEYFAGWAAYSPDGLRASREWLTGATGIALALLAAVTGTPPEWDRVLLASPSLAALARP